MLNPFAQRLLMAHYEKCFQPLNDPEYSERDDDTRPCAGLRLMRMLCRRPDGQLMQVLATVGASQVSLPREEGFGRQRNEYITFLPAAWDLADEKHLWIMNMLADLCDYAAKAREPLTYGHRIAMYDDAPENQPDITMTGCILLEPFAGEKPEMLTCRTGLFSKVNLLHMMPLTAAELEWDADDLLERFYPEDGSPAFLCARCL